MQIILSDENCSGQADAIFHALKRLGYLDMIPMELKKFHEIQLDEGADDETVWRYCQDNKYLLLTGNRSAKDGSASLEFTIRHLVTSTSLPVLTIGNLKRVLKDRQYCTQCAHGLAEIVLDLEERHLGVTRLYLT